MALIFCSECNKQISDKAPFCIGCGCPMDAIVQNKSGKEKKLNFTEKVLADKYILNLADENETLYRKALYYYKNDYIKDFKCNYNDISACVTDKNDFQVSIKLFDLVLKNYNCNCDYYKKNELPCKHIIAVYSFFKFNYLNKLCESEKNTFIETCKKNDYNDCFEIKNNVLIKYKGEYEAIDLPENIVGISEEAFLKNVKLKSIKFSSKIQFIGDRAFKNCNKLQEIIFNSQLLRIGNESFLNCSELKSFELPQDIQEIGNGAFSCCSSLTKVKLKNITFLNNKMFEYCRNLKEVSLPDTLNRIEESSFSFCDSLDEIKIPKNVEIIGKYAFYGCKSLMQLDLKETKITLIDAETFKDCISLEKIIFSRSLDEIGYKAFYGCISLKYIESINKIKKIGTKAFYDCKINFIQ